MNDYSDDDEEEERQTALSSLRRAAVQDVDDDEAEEDEEVKEGGEEEVKEDKVSYRDEYLPNEELDASSSDEEDDDDKFNEEATFRKIGKEMKYNVLHEYHPELQFRSTEEIQQMAHVIRNIQGDIIDPLHKTLPFLSKYEKARVLGERARQLEEGAQPFVQIPPDLVDSFVIAEMELENKVIPFILERPLPHGGTEYWRVCDLEQVV